MSYQIYVSTPEGALLNILSEFNRLEYARGESKTGWLSLDLDPTSVDLSMFRTDTRLEVWRQVGANQPYLDGETIFFVRKFGRKIDASGREIFSIAAKDANYIIDGRIVDYAAESAEAWKTAPIDNMIKAIVRENMGSLATDTARSLAAYLSVQVDLSAWTSTTKAFSHRNVADVLGELVNESFKLGTYAAYDIVYVSPTMLEFRTYTDRRGIDHSKASASPVVISRERGNLETPEEYEDHTDEATIIRAGGQGTGAARTIQTATNTAALGLSPFNRREKFVDARNTSDDGIQSEADAELFNSRSKRVLTGKIVDTQDCQYGVHYRFGDVVYAEYNKLGYDAHINAVHVTVQDGAETIECFVRGES